MKQDFGISEVISFIFVLLIILLLAAGVVLYAIPWIEEKKSAAESDAVLQQFSSLAAEMDELVLTNACGVERNAVFPTQYGTLSFSSGMDETFVLIYDSASSKDVVFEKGVLSCGEYTHQSAAGYMPAAAAADTVLQKNTAVVSVFLMRTYTDNGMTYAEFSVRLV